MKFDFEIDTAWCLEQLFKDGKISERDRMLVQTTHRQREQLNGILADRQFSSGRSIPSSNDTDPEPFMSMAGRKPA